MAALAGLFSTSLFPAKNLPPPNRLRFSNRKPFSVMAMSEDPVREWILTEGKASDIKRISSVGGHDTDVGSFFVKTNRSIGPSMFEGEALGLRLMYETNTIRVPTPFKGGKKLRIIIPNSKPPKLRLEASNSDHLLLAPQSIRRRDADADQFPSIRSRYQSEALEKAIKENTIVFLEAGSGKTLIAVMLLNSYSHFLNQSSPYKAVFLVPTIVLVTQQAQVVRNFTGLRVGTYSGEMKINLWDVNTWKEELDKHEVFVMTPQILLNALRHSFISLQFIKVLIFDECHNALKDHPYAQIMKEFYHPLSKASEVSSLPRILGMTASPVKAKGSSEASQYWAKMEKLESLMDSKLYTCEHQSMLDGCISLPEVKFKEFDQTVSPLSMEIKNKLSELVNKHMKSVKQRAQNRVLKKLMSRASTYEYCANELGVWLALKAVQDNDTSSQWKSPGHIIKVVESFDLDVQNSFSYYFPEAWSVHDDTISEANTRAGFLSSKVVCLQNCLLEYREVRELRCIVFVERVITAIALQSFLSEVLQKECGWITKYITGAKNPLKAQNRQDQSKVIDDFRAGKVNIIVATSILEEGLDVQSCNLVIRFDLPSNICSFIQSRGRARMMNSDFVLMVKRGDESEHAKAKLLIDSIEKMRAETLLHSSLPCEPIEPRLSDQMYYRVESTDATVNLSSSVFLIQFYCSKLPSDGYHKPSPHYNVESNTCTLQLPKSCPLQSVTVTSNDTNLRQLASLEACIKLHQMGALTDHLVPDIVGEANAEEQNHAEQLYETDQDLYFPPELVSNVQHLSSYHLYFIDMKASFESSVPLHNVILVFKAKLDLDIGSILTNIQVNKGCKVDVKMNYLREESFTKQRVMLCRMFQVAVFRALGGARFDKLNKAIDEALTGYESAYLDYLILPSTCSKNTTSATIDWRCISSVLFKSMNVSQSHDNCVFPEDTPQIYTKNGLMCRCMLKTSLVYTPHNGYLYSVYGFVNHMNINSNMCTDEGEDPITYKQHFKKRHNIDLRFDNEVLLGAKPMFRMHNFILSYGQKKRKAFDHTYCELPPELCYVIMSPISSTTFYTFSLVSLIMHRIESVLIAANLQRMYADQCTQNVITIPTMKILEAITTKKCEEAFHLESLETLGDSFLKYAVSQMLFKTHQNHHEDLLSLKRERIVSNDALCRLGCSKKIPGFIRNRAFDPTHWYASGDNHSLTEELVAPGRAMYKIGTQKLKSKRVADVVEALIGAFLSCGGEMAALYFMNWLGISVDSSYIPYNNQFQIDHTLPVDLNYVQSLLHYNFRDLSLLVEALTHGSYMGPEIPRSYQRLEFLGDAVLDHIITLHLYSENPGLSPGLLTQMRSASVNNDCYGYANIRVQLHNHILHNSIDLHRDFEETQRSCEKLLPNLTFGWDFDIHFPKVLGDVIESLAGAIFLDSGYDKDVVFKSLKPLLEPLVTPKTLKIHPMQELQLLCQEHKFVVKKPLVCVEEDGSISYKLEVEVDGTIHSETQTASDKKLAQKIASKAMLKSLKDLFVDVD